MTLSRTTILSTCLFVSLVGNVVLGGMITGKAEKKERPGSPSLRAIVQVIPSLPPELQPRLQAIIDPAKAALTEKYKNLDEQRVLIAGLLSGPEVDREALETAFAKYRVIVNDIEVTSQTAILNSALQLPLDSRKRIVEPPRRRAPQPRPEQPVTQAPGMPGVPMQSHAPFPQKVVRPDDTKP